MCADRILYCGQFPGREADSGPTASLEFSGALYHLTSRGNDRQAIYLLDEDRNGFLQLLEQTCGRYDWLCHAYYCLMDNHYHLLIETQQPTLSKGMKYLNGKYTQDFNRRYARSGHVFQGRFKVSLAGNGEEMQQILEETPIDLILLDIGLPGTDGIELIRRIKPSFGGGIILLTAHGEPEDRVLGLESGADDYVVKPFNFRELLARIHSVQRRLQTSDEPTLEETAHLVRFGNWTFDTVKRTLEGADGSCPELSPGELDILALLAERADTAVSRHEILEKSSHRDWNPLDRSIDVRITRLRKKLEQDAAKPTLIRTARNVGYILITTPPE